MLKIMDSMFKVTEETMPADATQFARMCIPYVEVDVLGDFDQVLKKRPVRSHLPVHRRL